MIRAIETVYAGTHFRSRLESRWAAFFDRIGWKWTYEPIDANGYIPGQRGLQGAVAGQLRGDARRWADV